MNNWDFLETQKFCSHETVVRMKKMNHRVGANICKALIYDM